MLYVQDICWAHEVQPENGCHCRYLIKHMMKTKDIDIILSDIISISKTHYKDLIDIIYLAKIRLLIMIRRLQWTLAPWKSFVS